MQSALFHRATLCTLLPGGTDGPEVLLAVLCRHSTAVVLDTDPVHTTQVVALQDDDHAFGVGVHSVPDQFLDGAHRISQPSQLCDVLAAGLKPHLDDDGSLLTCVSLIKTAN